MVQQETDLETKLGNRCCRWVVCQACVCQLKMEDLASTIDWQWLFPICGLNCWKKSQMIYGMLATSVTPSPTDGGKRSVLPMRSHTINPLLVTRQSLSGLWIRRAKHSRHGFLNRLRGFHEIPIFGIFWVPKTSTAPLLRRRCTMAWVWLSVPSHPL